MEETLSALRQAAIAAFSLPEGDEYEVSRELDGVKILNDEVFQFLSSAESGGKNLELVISPSTTRIVRSPPGTPTQNLQTPVSRNILGAANSNSPVDQPALPMRNIVENLDPVLEIALHPDGSQVTPAQYLKMKRLAIKETYQEVAKFIRKKVKKESFPIVRHYAELVLRYDGGKYSKLFEVQLGSTVKSGIAAFTLQIYNHLNYRKPEEEKRNKRRAPRRRLDENQVDEEAEDDVRPLPDTELTSAAYGCVAYSAPLPPEEREETQESSRVDLLSSDPESAESAVLMERTFPSQRCTINRRKVQVKEVFDLWPLLKHRTFFLSHAERLLGKDVRNVWSLNLGEKCGRFCDFMQAHFAAEDKRKSTARTTDMLAILREKEYVNGVFQQKEANSLALFPLLVGYNKESADVLFRVMPATTTKEEVEAISSGSPLLVIRGESIFDPSASADLLMAQEMVSAADVLDGFLLLILSYFIFGFKYPKKIGSSLEFVQRLLLDINPEVGTKRDMVAIRQNNFIDPKVRQLTEQLTFFCSAWNVCRF